MLSLLIDTEQGENLLVKYQELNKRYKALEKEKLELEQKYKKALGERDVLLSKINTLKEQNQSLGRNCNELKKHNHLLEKTGVVKEYIGASYALDKDKKAIKDTPDLKAKVRAFIDVVGTSMYISKLQYLYNRHKTEISNGWYYNFLSDIAKYSQLCKSDDSFYVRMNNNDLSADELKQFKTILEFLRDYFFPLQQQCSYYQDLETKFNKVMALLLTLKTLPQQSKIKMSQWNELLLAIDSFQDKS